MELSLYLTLQFLRGRGGEGFKTILHDIRRGDYIIMMLDYKVGSGGQEYGKK